jgi:carbon starvation protein CstA
MRPKIFLSMTINGYESCDSGLPSAHAALRPRRFLIEMLIWAFAMKLVVGAVLATLHVEVTQTTTDATAGGGPVLMSSPPS